MIGKSFVKVMKTPLVICSLLATAVFATGAELHIPAFTAYSEPNAHSPRINAPGGIVGWTDPSQRASWFGEIKAAGVIDASVKLKLPKDAQSHLSLTVGKQTKEISVTGKDEEVTAAFGQFNISQPGYQRFTLESKNPTGKQAGDIEELILDGPATEGAHFNLDARRNAASVHLRYPVSKDADISAFYCEATGVEDPIATYYMACGFQRGYFGMQVNSPTERRIIFSVWDSGAGTKAAKRDEVADADQTRLLAKGDGVVASAFGNEGTGGHSHFIYPWKTGERQRFVVTVKPAENGSAIFSGYWFHPEKKTWMLLATFQAPKATGSLSGLYSFCEDFDGANGQLRRKALFGNQWIRLRDGQWKELTEATFSHDPTGKTARLDRFMGVENGQFFLSNGGFIPGSSRYGEAMTRPAKGTPPSDINLPEPK